MGECRIYNLPNKAYDGALRVPVEKAGETTGSIELSAIQNIKTINGISPDNNGNVSLGFNENELYKFQKVNSFSDLTTQDIKSGFCYYTVGELIEGKPLRYIDKMCVAENIWTFVTPTTHEVTLNPGTYTVIAVGGGGVANTTAYVAQAAGGGSGACLSGQLSFSQITDLSIKVGNTAEKTTLSSVTDNKLICSIENGNSGHVNGLDVAGGEGGLSSNCYVDSIFSDYALSSGNNGGTTAYWGVSGGNYANELYKYGGGGGTQTVYGSGTSYNPQSGYVRIQKVD